MRRVSCVCSMCLCLIMPVVHGHGRGNSLGTCIVVKPCASRAMSLQHVCMHHLTFLAKNSSIYTLYTCAPKGYINCVVQKPKATRLVLKYRSTNALTTHSATLQSSLYIRLPTKCRGCPSYTAQSRVPAPSPFVCLADW